MRILVVDPGQTSGFVVLETIPEGNGGTPRPEILLSWQEGKAEGLDTLYLWAHNLLRIFQRTTPHVVVVEDYRVYANKATQHIGQQLFTAELIGVIAALAAVVIPPVPMVRIPAAKKGRWPKARLDNKFPIHTEVVGQHARDALQLGLAYLESQELWKP